MQFIQMVPWWGWVIVAVLALAVLGFVLSIIKKSAEGFKYIFLIVFWIVKIAFYVVCSPFLIIIWIVKKRKAKKRTEPFFAQFHDAQTLHHPQYVYKESKKTFKGVGITKSNKTDGNNIPLDINPGPVDYPAYILPRPNKIKKQHKGKRTRFKRLDGWSFKTKDDIKKVKKVMRRLPRRRRKKPKK